MTTVTRDDESPSARELRRKARERFALAERLEAEYMRALRNLTRQVDTIIKTMAPNGKVRNEMALQQALRKYSEAITPWAETVAAKMIARVAKKDESNWTVLSRNVGMNLHNEIQNAPTGDFLRQMLNEQVHLITSLPLDAAQRVHELTLKGMVQGARATEIQKEILKTGKVTESRAMLIARTEIARTASGLTMARSQYVGCTHYVWRTSRDGSVRESHKHMEGKVIAWADPPTLEDGTKTHAGMIYNCRCYAEPILPEIID